MPAHTSKKLKINRRLLRGDTAGNATEDTNQANQSESHVLGEKTLSNNEEAAQHSTQLNSPSNRHRQLVLEIFTPASPHRRKRNSNAHPAKLDGGSSFNGSILSSNTGLEEFKRFQDVGSDRDWLAVVRE